VAIQSSADYQLGKDLGIAIQKLRQRRPALILNVVSDLMDADRSLQAPLRELAHTQAFTKANPQQSPALSSALVSSLLMELGTIYREETLHRLHCVLAGYFSLPEPKLQRPTNHHPDSTPKPTVTVTAIQPERERGGSAQGDGTGSSHQERANPMDAGLQRLRQFLQAQEWEQADRATWDLLSGSLGNGTEGLIPSEAWAAIPCTLLYEINQAWATSSSHRFGFATQRAIWEESIRLHKRLTEETQGSSAITIKSASQVFSEFLSDETTAPSFGFNASQATCIRLSDLPPGHFPRSGKERVWGDAKGWVSEYRSHFLTASFHLVYERLSDCGITPTTLDSASKQKLAALFICHDPTPSPSDHDDAGEPAQNTPIPRSAGTTKPPPSRASSSTQHGQASPEHRSARREQDSKPRSRRTGGEVPHPPSPTSDSHHQQLIKIIAALYTVFSISLWGATEAGTRQTCSSWFWVARPICFLTESTRSNGPERAP
jgi:hypothetical protein